MDLAQRIKEFLTRFQIEAKARRALRKLVPSDFYEVEVVSPEEYRAKYLTGNAITIGHLIILRSDRIRLTTVLHEYRHVWQYYYRVPWGLLRREHDAYSFAFKFSEMPWVQGWWQYFFPQER